MRLVFGNSQLAAGEVLGLFGKRYKYKYGGSKSRGILFGVPFKGMVFYLGVYFGGPYCRKLSYRHVHNPLLCAGGWPLEDFKRPQADHSASFAVWPVGYQSSSGAVPGSSKPCKVGQSWAGHEIESKSEQALGALTGERTESAGPAGPHTANHEPREAVDAGQPVKARLGRVAFCSALLAHLLLLEKKTPFPPLLRELAREDPAADLSSGPSHRFHLSTAKALRASLRSWRGGQVRSVIVRGIASYRLPSLLSVYRPGWLMKLVLELAFHACRASLSKSHLYFSRGSEPNPVTWVSFRRLGL